MASAARRATSSSDGDLVRVVPVPGCRPDGERAEPLPAGDQRRPRSPPAAAPSGTGVPVRMASRARASTESGPASPSVACSCGSIASSAWVAAASRSSPPLVGGVHRAPLAEPRHHQLRDERQGQLDVERLGEQLAGLGEERQPGLPAHGRRGAAGRSPGAARAARRPASASGRAYAVGAASSSSSPAHGRCTAAAPGSASSPGAAAGRTAASMCGPAPSPASRRTTPPAAPISSAEPGAAARRRSRPGASSACGSGLACSSALAPRRWARRRCRSVGARRASAGDRVPGPAGTTRPCRCAWWVVPQRLAKWSTSSSPRPRSASSAMSEGSSPADGAAGSTGAGGEVDDRHGQAGRVGDDLDVQFGAGVHDRVGGQLGGQQQRLVEQLVQPRLGEHAPARLPGPRPGCAGRRAAGPGGRACPGCPLSVTRRRLTRLRLLRPGHSSKLATGIRRPLANPHPSASGPPGPRDYAGRRTDGAAGPPGPEDNDDDGTRTDRLARPQSPTRPRCSPSSPQALRRVAGVTLKVRLPRRTGAGRRGGRRVQRRGRPPGAAATGTCGGSAGSSAGTAGSPSGWTRRASRAPGGRRRARSTR